jgi:hypothetical protein
MQGHNPSIGHENLIMVQKLPKIIGWGVEYVLILFGSQQINHNIGLNRLLGLQEVEAPRISTQSAREGGKVVSPIPLPPRRYPWYSFMLEVESTPGP